jgi:hypothetical protein
MVRIPLKKILWWYWESDIHSDLPENSTSLSEYFTNVLQLLNAPEKIRVKIQVIFSYLAKLQKVSLHNSENET